MNAAMKYRVRRRCWAEIVVADGPGRGNLPLNVAWEAPMLSLVGRMPFSRSAGRSTSRARFRPISRSKGVGISWFGGYGGWG